VSSFEQPRLERNRHNDISLGLHVADSDHRERWMTYLSNVTNERPMLRISATIVLAFTCAAPFVLLFSDLVAQGVRALIQ
jgi:hypothetical protein